MTEVDSASDDRTVNNTLRHKYRVLTDAEKAQMQAVKDKGQEFLGLIESLRTPSVPLGANEDGIEMAMGTVDVDLNRANERLMEAVFWAVHHITA